MKNDGRKLLRLSSFENSSILRKFTVLFLITSIVPMALLYYFYFETSQHGQIGIPATNFTYAMILTGLGIFIGFITIRSLLVKVIDISRQNTRTMEELLGPEALEKLGQEENEIDVLSRSFSAVTERLQENARDLDAAQQTLRTVMTRVGHGLTNMQSIDTFLELILETFTSALKGEVSALLLLNDKKTDLIIHAVYGAGHDGKEKMEIKLFEGSPLARVLTEKKAMCVSGIFMQCSSKPLLNQLFSGNVLCTPLVHKDRVSGLMVVNRAAQEKEDFSREDLEAAFQLSSQTAIAIENSRRSRDIEKTYFETLCALALAVDAKDKHSQGHLERVADYALMIGERLGLDDEDMDTLRDGARLHDLGKIGIPDGILMKEGPLSDDEWLVMRRHPQIGESIIKPVRSLQPLCDLVRHHHEKLDGSGYPDGLKGEEISPLVRILSVAETYDGLTSACAYHSRKTKQEAISSLRAMKDKLDQDIVDILIEALNS